MFFFCFPLSHPALPFRSVSLSHRRVVHAVPPFVAALAPQRSFVACIYFHVSFSVPSAPTMFYFSICVCVCFLSLSHTHILSVVVVPLSALALKCDVTVAFARRETCQQGCLKKASLWRALGASREAKTAPIQTPHTSERKICFLTQFQRRALSWHT